MELSNIKQTKESGFTLVELAIVMIIIGLLIGGILKGQELIANSQLTATVAQIKGIDAGLSTFRDKYGALPGDMLTPGTRLAGCTAAPCTTPGNANGRVEQGAVGSVPGAAAPVIGDEAVTAFSHMSAADLLSGIDANSGAAPVGFGTNLPESKVGGGFWMGYSAGGLTDVNAPAIPRNGHYLILNGIPGAVAAGSGILSAGQVAQIDRKLDDGQPTTGTVLVNTGTRCLSGVLYNEGDVGGPTTCATYIRIQG